MADATRENGATPDARFIASIGCPECGRPIDEIVRPPREISSTRHITRTTTTLRCSGCDSTFILNAELMSA